MSHVITHRDGVAGADIAYIGNISDEVTPLSQRFKRTTCPIAILTHLQPQRQLSILPPNLLQTPSVAMPAFVCRLFCTIAFYVFKFCLMVMP